jgi:1-acyl-sn-glycerol-3-phosphate acyltransferase
VQQAIDMFAQRDSFYFALAPEGTRKKQPGWKTGFYRIAAGADIPVYLCLLDYKSKRVGVGRRLDLSGNPEADLEICRDFYAEIEGRWPNRSSEIVFSNQNGVGFNPPP